MKPAIAWALRRNYGTPAGFEIIEITSERGNAVHGRKSNGQPTHFVQSEIVARFATAQPAVDAMSRAEAVLARLEPIVRYHTKRADDLRSALTACLHAAALNKPLDETAFEDPARRHKSGASLGGDA